jgi:two-component system nitrogen regulation sensor histidine kinase GlnL
MAAERRILLLSSSEHVAPELGRLLAERRCDLVRAADAAAAVESLRADRFACALIDLDVLGDEAASFLARAHGLRPEMRTVAFGAQRPRAQLDGLAWVATPLSDADLAVALDASLAAADERPAARIPSDGPQVELHRRVGQLTTLYQIARAISESRNWSEALDYFLATLRDYLGVRGAAILLYSREGTVLAPRTVLGMSPEDTAAAARTLLDAYPIAAPIGEIHPLECWRSGRLRCEGHAGRFRHTVLPLLYRRTPLGFLVLEKDYAPGGEFGSELFFLQTIQTVLGEEVANAVHLSRLVDLKNFNEAVLDNVESGVVTATESGRLTFANRLARAILGLDASAPLAPDLSFDAVFAVGDGAPFVAWRDREAAGPSRGGEALRGDGRRVPVRLRARRIIDPSDSEPLWVVAFEDLTPQRALEEQVRRADRLRSLGELSAAIAHEVRNPLQGISLTLSNLQEYLAPGAEPYVQVMFAEMERLNAIVGGILSFARPASPQPFEVGLGSVCARALDLAAERAAQRGVELVLLPVTDPDDRAEVDEGQMIQVVLNLVLNGIDAAPPGGRVRVRCERVATPAGSAPRCRIAVHDDGPGIPDDARERLFDPFFTTKSDGTGLGLAVCQKIVAEHHGSIHVDSRPASGTTFTVDVPARFAGPGPV